MKVRILGDEVIEIILSLLKLEKRMFVPTDEIKDVISGPKVEVLAFLGNSDGKDVVIEVAVSFQYS